MGFPAIAQSKPDQLIIPDAGGILRDAHIKAHYDTFTAATGIKIVPAEYMGVAQLKAMVDNKAWGGGDVIALGRRGGDRQQAGAGGEDRLQPDRSAQDGPAGGP
jgi:spermidine/putrescine-binding protein